MTHLFIGKTNSLGGFDIFYELPWILDEDFDNLIKLSPFKLSETAVVNILAMSNLSETEKILLSAAAGAAIQHLIDCADGDFETREIAFEKDPE